MTHDPIGFVLADTARLLRRRFDARARALGSTRAQWQVLISLSRAEGINQAGLAERLDVENITLCRMVDRLAESGLVERRPDPGDRRAWQLYLTDAARPILEAMRAVGAEVQAEAMAGLSDAEVEMLIRLLERVRANLSTRPAQAAQG